MEENIVVKLQHAEYFVRVDNIHYTILTNVQIDKVTETHVVFEYENKILNTPLGEDWNSSDNYYFIKFQSYKID